MSILIYNINIVNLSKTICHINPRTDTFTYIDGCCNVAPQSASSLTKSSK